MRPSARVAFGGRRGMSDLAGWLKKLGLEQYAEVFERNGVDRDSLAHLGEPDLVALGLLLGHRRILQAALTHEAARASQAAAASTAFPTGARTAASDEAERRLLTVLFCDLMDSTRLSSELELEDYRALIAAYQEACSRVLARYGGYLAKFMGDGVLAYFGYPTAHDDDAQRAVRAALDLVKVVPDLEYSPGQRPAVRVGIATGEVVVGDIVGAETAEERAVLGVTPNLAARLQAIAAQNEIIVSEGTSHRLLERFKLTPLGAVSLKGIPRPTKAWRIEGLAERPQALVSAAAFVGRQDALRRMAEAWERVGRAGGLEIFHLCGPPGIGKTRLVQEFIKIQAPAQLEVWTCSAFQGNQPLHPLPGAQLVIESSRDAGGARGAAQRRVLFDSILEQLARRLAAGPLLLFIEDIHWIDPTTAELLALLRRRLAKQPLLLLLASRPGARADDLTDNLGGTRIDLAALDGKESALLVEAVAKTRLPPATCQRIVERAGGLPLFLEELTGVVERGESDGIPVSLQESLLARLDSVGSAKRVAQLASVVGRSFRRADLASLAELNDQHLGAALDRLLSSGLLVERDGGYAFRHALFQDAAYETLLHSTRRRVHGEIADHRIAQGSSTEPEVIARHLLGAGRPAEAAPYWLTAARHSAALWAHSEAATYYTAGLQGTVAGADDAWELAARLDLVESLRILDRADEALAELELSEVLAARVDRDADWLRLHVLRGNILFPLGEAERCLASQQAALSVARRMADPEAEARALSGVGDAQFARARLASAEQAYDACVKIAAQHGLEAIVSANISLRGHMRLYLCRIDEARQDCQQAVEMALAAGDRRAELTARGSCLGKVLLEAGELSAANRLFVDSVQLAEELEAHRFVALNLMFQAKVALYWGAGAEALTLGQRAVAIARETAPRFCLPMTLGVVARAADDPQVCRAALAEAETLMAAGYLAYNSLWLYRDAALAAAEQGWPDEARRLAQALRDAFAAEPLPWCDLVAAGADALAEVLERRDRTAVDAVMARAEALGFETWRRYLDDFASRALAPA